MNFLAELRKRNVFRVLAAYLVGAWVAMQVVGLVAEASGLPAWADTLVLMILVAGLPVVGIAAWALELTPDGVKKSGTQTELAPRPIGPVDYVLIAAVVVVLGLFAWQMVAGPSGGERSMAAGDQIEGTSIAVMPFVAMSGDEEDAYLGDGLAEELLNVLAQFPDLMVAGRTSSFSFRDSNDGIQAIGEALGVSHVLEGSVRRAGEQLRITAQLIRSSDGFHVWSGTYDRPFADVLAVQDDIVRQIAQVLTVRLGVGAAAHGASQATVPAAYGQYLQGRYLFAERHVDENRSAAISAFQTAVDIDSDFAEGWAALGRAISYSAPPNFDEAEAWSARGERAARRALGLDPDSAEAHVALSYHALNDARDWTASAEHVERALARAPNAAFVHYAAAFHYEYMGEVDRAASANRRAIALDPLNLTIRVNAAEAFVRMRQFDEARRVVNAPGMPTFPAASVERDIAVTREDAQAMELAFAAWDAAVEAESADVAFLASVRQEMRALQLASAREDHEAIPELLEATLAATEVLPVPESFKNGWRSYFHLLARNYQTAAELLNQSDFGPFDEAIYLALNENPTEYLCQPAYHEVWQRPGIPELMEIRRANGVTGNLPLSGPECEPFLQSE